MIERTLQNGLKIVAERRENTKLAVVNILYKVGSRNEYLGKTGLAHFLEHLMFEGSKQYPSFDRAVHSIGGENNAFTTNDYTNYYQIVPSENIRTALLLEADRMKNLNLTKRAFNNQKKVVIEEFKETHLNAPYGEHWHKLSDMMYRGHYYEWPVIGKTISEVESISYDDIIQFYKKFYTPSNAVISIVGGIDEEKAVNEIAAIFESIPASAIEPLSISHLPDSIQHYQLCKEEVPSNAFYAATYSPMRFEPNFYTADLFCDVLSNGENAILHQKLVKREKLLSEVDAYLSATLDTGILVIEGKLNDHITLDQVRDSIQSILDHYIRNGVESKILENVKNKALSYGYFSNYHLVNHANNLAFFATYDQAVNMKKEGEFYGAVNESQMNQYIHEVFSKQEIAWLEYQKK